MKISFISLILLVIILFDVNSKPKIAITMERPEIVMQLLYYPGRKENDKIL